MTSLRKYVTLLCMPLAALCAQAQQSVLSVPDFPNDSTIVFPESVETDVHRMMQNWYLETYTALDRDADTQPDVVTSDEEIIKRLRTMPTAIEMPFNSVVRAYIDMYTGKKRGLVESMLGMSLYYMPIFEEHLEREGVPNELKYLPVIESALNPDAVSRVGATGLWQIMLPTARGLGLEVNALVDERRDPIASTAAAAKYLRQLYDIYGDWSLAIAAYNCGPGNVNKAMRRASDATPGDSSKKDFWQIYPYLPAETRGYVPCFIAANYVMNYYNKHNISPALAKRPIITDSVHVNRRVHFNQIADILHIPVEELKILNPQYRKMEIPGDIRPYSLVLPANQIYSYIMSEDAIAAYNAPLYARRDVVEPASATEPTQGTVNGKEGEWVTTEEVKYHKVKRNETMASIAKRYGVSLRSLKHANGNIRKPRRGQTLKVVTSKRVFRPFENQPAEDDNLLVRNDEALLAAGVSAGTSEETVTLESAIPETPVEEPREVVFVDPDAPAQDAVSDTPDAEPSADTAEIPAAETEDVTAGTMASDAAANGSSEASSKVAGTFRAAEAKKAETEARKAEAEAQARRDAEKQAKSSARSSKGKNGRKSASTYTVRKGDSLFEIAQKNGTTVAKLRKLNNIKGNKIKPGDKIKLK